MAAARRDEAADEDEQSRKRRLTPVDGRVTAWDQDDLKDLIRFLPRGRYDVELTYLVLTSVSLERIPKELCALPNLTRLGAIFFRLSVDPHVLMFSDCSGNQLTHIPQEISKLVALTHLGMQREHWDNIILY